MEEQGKKVGGVNYVNGRKQVEGISIAEMVVCLHGVNTQAIPYGNS